MLSIGFLFEVSNGNMILGFVPESLALLLFGVCLIGATLVLRRLFNRQDRGKLIHTTREGK